MTHVVTLIKMVLKRAYNFCFDREIKRIITESLNYLGFPFLSGALKMNMFMYLKKDLDKGNYMAKKNALFQLFPFKSLWTKLHFFSFSHSKAYGPKCTFSAFPIQKLMGQNALFSACPMQKPMDQNALFQLFPFKSLWA